MNMSDQPLHKILISFAEACYKEKQSDIDPCMMACDECLLLIEYEADIRLRFAEIIRKYIAEDCVTL
jgi:hypothetical protein